MSTAPHTVSGLRALLAARFPERNRRSGGCVASTVPAIDEALGGGLPGGRLTELVSASPSGGGQTVIAQLLGATQAARQRLALIDGADAFAPEAVPAHLLRHLVWVRCREPADAFAAADILVRDGNYAAVVLDLRGCAERVLRRTPASVWYRLQRAAESGSVAVLVQTTQPLVPAVPWRLVLDESRALSDTLEVRERLAGRMGVRTERSHAAVSEERAG